MTLLEAARFYLRTVSGDHRYDTYVERCGETGTPALSRRDFERQRSAHRDTHPEGRCC